MPSTTTQARRSRRAPAIASPHQASPRELDLVAELVTTIRPDWDLTLVTVVLRAHRDQCDASDLAIAAIRAARSPDVQTPRWIWQRGPWWDQSITCPPYLAARAKCRICGKIETECYLQRPGPDDHLFEPPPSEQERA